MKIKTRHYVYLIYLIMVTLIVTVVSFSRYETILDATDQVTVAKPVMDYVPVSATLNGVAVADVSTGISLIDILPGDELVYHFDIKNFQGTGMDLEVNQVLLKYNIQVTFNPSVTNLPLSYTLIPSDIYPDAGGGWIYLYYGTQLTHSYTLTVSWDEVDDDIIYRNKQQAIEIQIDAEQADF